MCPITFIWKNLIVSTHYLLASLILYRFDRVSFTRISLFELILNRIPAFLSPISQRIKKKKKNIQQTGKKIR